MEAFGPTPSAGMGEDDDATRAEGGADATQLSDAPPPSGDDTAASNPPADAETKSNPTASQGGTEANAWPSALPTQRPGGRKSSVFGQLLAEAGTALIDDHSGKTVANDPSKPPAPKGAGASPSKRSLEGPTLGSYRILSELGSGGMAVVYKAVQPALDRLVAIKELRAEFAHDAQIRARFEREATSLAAIQHGNIVHVYDYLEDDESAYIVMEYVDGTDLFDLLGETGALPPDVATVVGLQLAEALEYAHYRGIVHRDIKPSNVLISRTGEVKVMDFGIARDAERVDLTQVGMSLGTPAYMSPEQIAGDRIDFRADIFCFGIVFYEMLTGKKPWGEDENGRTVTRRVLYEPPISPRVHNPQFLPELEAIIDRCLKKDPSDRFRSTHELRREIQKFVAREVSIDSRQRLVAFLKNRGVLSDGEASSLVDKSILQDPVYRRRDLGLASPPAVGLLRPIVYAGAAALLLVALAGVIGATTGFGERLPPTPPPVSVR